MTACPVERGLAVRTGQEESGRRGRTAAWGGDEGGGGHGGRLVARRGLRALHGSLEPAARAAVPALAACARRAALGRRRLRERRPQLRDPGPLLPHPAHRRRPVGGAGRRGRPADPRPTGQLRGRHREQPPRQVVRRGGVGTRPQLRPRPRRRCLGDGPGRTGRHRGGVRLGLRRGDADAAHVLGRRLRARPRRGRPQRGPPVLVRCRGSCRRCGGKQDSRTCRPGRSACRRCSRTSTTSGHRSSVARARRPGTSRR